MHANLDATRRLCSQSTTCEHVFVFMCRLRPHVRNCRPLRSPPPESGRLFYLLRALCSCAWRTARAARWHRQCKVVASRTHGPSSPCRLVPFRTRVCSLACSSDASARGRAGQDADGASPLLPLTHSRTLRNTHRRQKSACFA